MALYFKRRAVTPNIAQDPMPKADPKLSAVKTESDVHLVKDVVRDIRCGSGTSRSVAIENDEQSQKRRDHKQPEVDKELQEHVVLVLL
jgi:hypothetical protein